MTGRARDWISTFADEAVLSDLFAAARDCMAQVCAHKPEDCDCDLNRFTPVEFAEFVELQVRQEGRRPIRFEAGHRPRRKDDEPPTLNLVVAG